MYVKKCEQTVDCWLKEVDGWLKEVDGWLKEVEKRGKKQVQKVSRKEKKSKCRKLAGGKNEKCESLFVCVCTTRTD